MAINKNHPKYVEYIQKCYAIVRRGEKEEDSIPRGDEWALVALHKKYMDELKMLQQEYSYLFTEEYEENEENSQ